MIDEDVNMNVNQNSSVKNHDEIINNEQIKQSDEIDTFLGIIMIIFKIYQKNKIS